MIETVFILVSKRLMNHEWSTDVYSPRKSLNRWPVLVCGTRKGFNLQDREETRSYQRFVIRLNDLCPNVTAASRIMITKRRPVMRLMVYERKRTSPSVDWILGPSLGYQTMVKRLVFFLVAVNPSMAMRRNVRPLNRYEKMSQRSNFFRIIVHLSRSVWMPGSGCKRMSRHGGAVRILSYELLGFNHCLDANRLSLLLYYSLWTVHE